MPRLPARPAQAAAHPAARPLRPAPRRRALVLIATLVLLGGLGLSGCGFELRGSYGQLPAAWSPLQLAGLDAAPALRDTLAQALRQAGLTLTPSAEAAASRLQLTALRERERTLAVDSAGDAVEFALESGLRFTLRLPDGRELGPQALSTTRTLYAPATQALSREREIERLRTEMHQDLARQLIDRLQAGAR